MEDHKTSRQSEPAGKSPGGLNRKRMASVCATVVQYLKTSRRYLSPNLSVWELAHEVGVSPKVLSQSLNRYMERNFFEFLNRIRIEEAKKLLREAAAEDAKVNVDGIGEKSGFPSRRVFFARFKEYEGITPKKYMNIHRGIDVKPLKQKE